LTALVIICWRWADIFAFYTWATELSFLSSFNVVRVAGSACYTWLFVSAV